MQGVLAMAASARASADKPQVGVAALLGTLVALTLWMLYLLLTWPSPVLPLEHSQNVATEAKGASTKKSSKKKKEGKKTK